MVCMAPDLLPAARPPYEQMFAIYGPNPDCINRDAHIRYLTKLKGYPVQGGDNRNDYDRAIDQYVARMEYYCQ